MTKRELIMRISDETGLIQQDVQAVLQKKFGLYCRGAKK